MSVTVYAILAGIALLLAAALLVATRRKMFVFEIRIRDGNAFVRSGSPRSTFVSDVQEIANRHAIERADIRGIRARNSLRLSFDGAMPDAAKQQMRNAWSLLR